jgi:branched-chain amino acid transport system substrate-binding protein
MRGALRGLRGILSLAAFTLAVGCGERAPILVGYIGGTSGRVSDLGVAGRNGTLLAIEHRNAAGGVDGRKIELLAKDDLQSAAEGIKAAQALIDNKVDVIIGPMTSVVGVAVAPVVTQARVVAISPTVATNDLSGIDDYFFRTIASTRVLAARHAQMQLARGIRRVALAMDLRNASYTKSWTADFTKAFESGGGQVLLRATFESSDNVAFVELARQLTQARGDAVVLVCNSVDTALLAQQIRKIDSTVRLMTPEWAATERLIELGGKAAEGMIVAQYFDRESARPEFQAFRREYMQRFGAEPGFPGTLAYESTVIALDALAARQRGDDLKQSLLRIRKFNALLGTVEFDAFGDSAGQTFFAEVRDGKFKGIE